MSLLSLIFGSPKSKRRKLETRNFNEYEQYKDKNGKWQFSHRRAAEKKLGGKIWNNYVVHHRDGNKRNNRYENLVVMPRSKHSKLLWLKRIMVD